MTQRQPSGAKRFLHGCSQALALFAILLAFIALFQLHFGFRECNCVGRNTTLVKYELTWLGISLERRITPSSLSRLIEQYLGSQPAETAWAATWINEGSLFESFPFCPGRILAKMQDDLTVIISGNMTDEAKRKCLREFIKASNDGADFANKAILYVNAVRAATGLGRPAEEADIPTYASVRAAWAEVHARPSVAEMEKRSIEASSQPVDTAARQAGAEVSTTR